MADRCHEGHRRPCGDEAAARLKQADAGRPAHIAAICVVGLDGCGGSNSIPLLRSEAISNRIQVSQSRGQRDLLGFGFKFNPAMPAQTCG